ncbi:MAG: EI24 domain-containing protein [Fibrobacterales bacterium]
MLKLLPGLGFIIEGFLFLKAHKILWKYCYLPALISLLLFIPLVMNLGTMVDFFNELIIPTSVIEGSETAIEVEGEQGFIATIGEAAGQGFWKVIAIIAKIIIWIFSIIIALLFYLITLKILSAPFNDILSENIENILLKREPTKTNFKDFKDGILISLFSELQGLLIFLVIFLPLWFASFIIVGPGQVIVTILLIAYASFWLTYDAMSYTMDRKKWKLTKRILFMIKHPFNSFGFGCCLYGLAIIPLLNMFLMPLFVAGGTLMLHELHQDKL